MHSKKLPWIVGGVGVLLFLLFVSMTVPKMPMGQNTASSIAYPGVAEEFPMMEAYDDSYDAGVPTPSRDVSVIYPPETQTAGETAADVDQKLIKTGRLDLVVDDVAEAESKISALATGDGGYVQDSDVSEREDGTHYGDVTVRVPSASFETAMESIKSYAATVRTESSQGQDVTEQYTDLEAQLRNAQAQEAEYLKILAQAGTVEEILQVQSYLSSVRYTVESLQGRLQYLENRTSYSTISVSLSEEPTVRIPTKEFRFGAIVNEAAQALVAIAQNLAAAVVWLVIVGGGILVPLAALAWIVMRVAKKHRK